MKKLCHENETRAYIETPDDIDEGCKSIVAILNKVGSGELIIGVKKDGTIIGNSSFNNSLVEAIFERIQKFISPKIYPSIFSDPQSNIIRISFTGSNRPYIYKKSYYIRSYDENREMDFNSAMNELKFQFPNTFFEESKTSESSRDVDESIIKDLYARTGVKKQRYTFLKDALKSLKLVTDGNLNLAGRNLFSKNNPLNIQINTYEDEYKKKIVKSALIKGNIFELIDKVLNTIEIEQTKAISSRRIGSDLIKETLLFSFLNSSFNLKEPYIIHVSPYEISFKYPGTLFYLDNLEEYFSGSYKIQNRNKIIARIFNMAGFTHTSEKCLEKIGKICKQENIIYSAITSPTNLTISYIRYSEKKKTVTLEQAILTILTNRPMIKADVLAKKLGKTRRTIQTYIRKLKESNLITRKGSNKNGYWIVNK